MMSEQGSSSATEHAAAASFVPESHPRAKSLRIRELLVDGFERGLVAREGLLAQGRGEAFDYLLGEKTGMPARRAIRAAAACILAAKRPVISVNGNAAALCPEEMVRLAKQTNAGLEVNLFYASARRRDVIAAVLRENGATEVLGVDPEDSGVLPGLDSARRVADKKGILAADVVVVPLEDGDRTAALVDAGKKVITFDLNPLSRTAQTADVTIVDNLVRAAGLLREECERLQAEGGDGSVLEEMVAGFDNRENLRECVAQIRDNLECMADA